jgi:hypothetical protein
MSIVTFDRRSAEQIARMVRAERARPANELPGPRRNMEAAVGRQVWTGRTTTNAAHPEYPTGGDTFVCQIEDWVFTEEPGSQAVDARPHELRFVIARNFYEEHVAEDTDVLLYRVPTMAGSRWWFIPQPPPAIEIRGGCLEENHPGRGIVFEIALGVWSSSNHKWSYTAGTKKAIDWRYGVPYPPAGATGSFIQRPSDTHGSIWEVLDLDCESPGECGD